MNSIMPRLARLDAPGVIHHVMIRGIERRKIFRNNKDRNDMMDRLADLLPATNPSSARKTSISGNWFVTSIFTLLNFPEGTLFNRVNPLRAKVVSNITGLNRYKYCGHSALMGKRQCPWQDKRYVLSCFGKSLSSGRDNYYAYVKDGLDQGGRPELVGGGLIRSLGGWAEARMVRLKGQDRMKGDERILGDGDFVMNILSEADERLDRRYELKSLGYDLDKVAQRVLEIYQIEREDLYSKGRQRTRAEARGLFCYWAVRELGYGQAELGRRLGMTQSGVGYAVQRGEHIAKENNFLIGK